MLYKIFFFKTHVCYHFKFLICAFTNSYSESLLVFYSMQLFYQNFYEYYYLTFQNILLVSLVFFAFLCFNKCKIITLLTSYDPNLCMRKNESDFITLKLLKMFYKYQCTVLANSILIIILSLLLFFTENVILFTAYLLYTSMIRKRNF